MTYSMGLWVCAGITGLLTGLVMAAASDCSRLEVAAVGGAIATVWFALTAFSQADIFK